MTGALYNNERAIDAGFAQRRVQRLTLLERRLRSASPCTMRNGGSLLEIYRVGLAALSFPELTGPENSTTACTRLDESAPFSPADVPNRAAIRPPSEKPQTPMWSASRLYFPAFFRSQRIAALQSSSWGGEACFRERSVVDAGDGILVPHHPGNRARVFGGERALFGVNPDDRRQGLLGLFGQVQVESKAFASHSRILHVSLHGKTSSLATRARARRWAGQPLSTQGRATEQRNKSVFFARQDLFRASETNSELAALRARVPSCRPAALSLLLHGPICITSSPAASSWARRRVPKHESPASRRSDDIRRFSFIHPFTRKTAPLPRGCFRERFKAARDPTCGLASGSSLESQTHRPLQAARSPRPNFAYSECRSKRCCWGCRGD